VMALPTLVVQGACSPFPTRRICELLAAVLPDGQLMKVEGSGHMAPLTHRDAVNAAIAAHLDAVQKEWSQSTCPDPSPLGTLIG